MRVVWSHASFFTNLTSPQKINIWHTGVGQSKSYSRVLHNAVSQMVGLLCKLMETVTQDTVTTGFPIPNSLAKVAT